MNNLLEKPTHQVVPSNLAVLGRYILPPQLLDLLENTTHGAGEEIQLTYAQSGLLAKEGLNAVKTNAEIYDCGNALGYLNANLATRMRETKSRASIIALIKKLISEVI